MEEGRVFRSVLFFRELWVWSTSNENRRERSFLIWLFMHEYITSSTKCWTLNPFTNSFLNFDSFSWRNVYLGAGTQNIPLYQTRYYTPAFPSRSFLSRNAYCISLSVIMLDHKRSYIVIIAWNLSAIGSRRIRTIIVESSYFEDELIGREGVKSIARDTSRISSFFFLNSTLENFLSFLKRLICESMKRMHVVFFNFIMVL